MGGNGGKIMKDPHINRAQTWKCSTRQHRAEDRSRVEFPSAKAELVKVQGAQPRSPLKGGLIGGFFHWVLASSQRKMTLNSFELRIEFPRLDDNPD